MPTTVYFVRHGESAWNATGRYQGRLDAPLSDLGLRQADLLARRFAPVRLDAIYTSPLQRARVTAERIAACHGMAVVSEPGLTEIDHGEWNGMLRAEVERRYPETVRLWREAPGQVRMPGGESLADVRQRGMAAVDAIAAAHPNGAALVVSHHAVLKVVLGTLVGLGLEDFWTLDVDQASGSAAEIGGPWPLLTLLNDTCHLGGYRASTAERSV
ncbi:MAG: histidine phosphatase family protein [Chloroflexi bacterium]|nr:histidine phosphatase family protein [Chloroflexota bacterium]